jgi:hypothetical protein
MEKGQPIFTEAKHLGDVVRAFRLERDIPIEKFAAMISRSKGAIVKMEKSGKAYQRTWAVMFRLFPELRERVLKAVKE